MNDNDKKEIIEAARQGTLEALQDEMGKFYVEREQHYQDHCFVQDLRSALKGVKTSSLRIIVTLGITGTVTLIILGILYWLKKNISS